MANSVFPKVTHDWLKHETDPMLHRRAGVIKSGSGVVTTGQVIAKAAGSAVSAVVAGGTGNGVLTLDVISPVLANATPGAWTVRCITAAANGGTFRVEDPSGTVRGDVAVGATFADGIKFAIADGSADFVVGDSFTVTVTAGTKYVPLNFAATDGSQNAAAIVINMADATSADVETAILTGKAQIVGSQLTWPVGATTNQKNAALALLEALDIVDFQR